MCKDFSNLSELCESNLMSATVAGILLWSIGAALQGQDLVAGLVFAVLVNLKHLYATLGPVYVVYLLRHYCRWACTQQDGIR